MISKKLLGVMVGVFLIFLALAPMAEAATANAIYSKGQTGGSKTVTKGDNVKIEVASTGYGEKLEYQELYIRGGPNSVNDQLFRETKQGRNEQYGYEYGNTYNLDTGNYDAGTYTIEFVAKGRQSSESTSTLSLIIKKQTQPPQDNNAPSLTIDYPNQGQKYNSQVNELRYTPTDAEGNLDKCWYSTDGGQTNSSKVNCNDGTQNTFSSLASQDGQNTWTVWASDTEGNVAKESVTFTYNKSNGGGGDQNAPSVNILFPNSATYLNLNRADFTVNDPENNLNNCWYTIDGGPRILVGCQEFPNLNTININRGPGTYTLRIYAADNAGNVGQDTVVFTITGGGGGGDTTPPKIIPIHPQNNQNPLNNNQIRFDLDTNEDANVTYDLYDKTTGNYVVRNKNLPSGFSQNHESAMYSLTEGHKYTVTYFAVDQASNQNSKSVNFSIKNKSQGPGPSPNPGNGSQDKSGGGDSGGDDSFTPGQGGYYSHQKDEYLDRFDRDDRTVIDTKDGDQGQDKKFLSGLGTSWLLPLLATLIGLTMIALAFVLGVRESEKKEPVKQANYQKTPAKGYEPSEGSQQGPTMWY